MHKALWITALVFAGSTAEADEWGYYTDPPTYGQAHEWLPMFEMYVEGTSGLSESSYYAQDPDLFHITFNPTPILLVYLSMTPADPPSLSQALADYVDNGNDILIVQPTISAELLPEPFASYIPFTPGVGTYGGGRILSTIDGDTPGSPGAHPILSGALRFDYYGEVNDVALRPGADLVASFTGGAAAGVPAIAEWVPSGAGRVVALNFLPVSIYLDHQRGYDPRNGSDAFVGAALAYLTDLPPVPLQRYLQHWGSCGGPGFIGGRGFTPFGAVTGLLDATPEWDSYVEDVGACQDVELEFTGWRSKGPYQADAYGAVSFKRRPPSCYKALMAVDMETCDVAESVYVEP